MGHTVQIGYENLFEDDDVSSIVATNEASGFEKENAYNWLPYNWWKPGVTDTPQWLDITFSSSKTVDYFAVYAHNLGDEGATASFWYWTGSAWSKLAERTPTDTEVIFKTFTPQSATRFALQIDDSTIDAKFGAASFGSMLQLQHGMRAGFVPPSMDRNNKIINRKSIGGTFLGRSVRHTKNRLTLAADNFTAAWMRTNWTPFLDHAEKKPFFVSWDEVSYPKEAAYCWVSRNIDRQAYSNNNRMRIRLQCDCVLDGVGDG